MLNSQFKLENGMQLVFRVSLQSPVRVVALLLTTALLLTGSALGQSEPDDAPPPILKGGIVHQLRSLSEDALGALQRNDRASVPPARPARPARRQPLPQNISESAWVERIHDVEPSSSQTPSAQSPRSPSRPASMLTPATTSEVHVAESLPAVVRQSLRGTNSGAKTASQSPQGARPPRTQAPPDIAAFTNSGAATSLDRSSAIETPAALETDNQAPQVSRIPLPGRSAASPRNEVAKLRDKPSQVETPVEEPLSRLTTPDVPTSAAPSESSLTSDRPQSEAPLAQLPVAQPESQGQPASVPSTLVSTPRVERTELPLKTQTEESLHSGLPPLPATAEPTLPDLSPELPMGAPGAPTPQTLGQQPRTTTGEQRMKMETPRVEVSLTGPSDLPIDASAEFAVLVTNHDLTTLPGLLLRLDVPTGIKAQALKPTHGEVQVEQDRDGATLLTWSFENLEAGKTAVAPIEMLASAARNFGVSMEWTVMPVTGEAQIGVLSPQLELVLEGPSEVNFGEANTYRLRVRNPGTAAAKQVSVQLSAEPYGSSSSEIGAIQAGAEESIDVELTFNQAGAISITAAANAANDLSSLTKIDVLVRRPNLTASIEAPKQIFHGSAIDYRVTVGNTGDADAQELTTVVTLPAGAKLVHLPEQATLRAGKLTWPLAELKAGQTQDMLLQLNLAEEGEHRMQLECSTASGMTTHSTATTLVTALADLNLLVEDPLAPAPLGTEVPYELTLTNRGSKAATNVRVIAQFSEGVEPIRGEGRASRVVPGQLFFEPIDRVEAGQAVKLKVFAIAQQPGMHRFRAEVRSDDTEVRLVQEGTTPYLETTERVASPPSQPIIR